MKERVVANSVKRKHIICTGRRQPRKPGIEGLPSVLDNEDTDVRRNHPEPSDHSDCWYSVSIAQRKQHRACRRERDWRRGDYRTNIANSQLGTPMQGLDSRADTSGAPVVHNDVSWESRGHVSSRYKIGTVSVPCTGA